MIDVVLEIKIKTKYKMLKDGKMGNLNFIKELFKGIIIGIANIIPGVSGGTLAVSMGIYDKIISAVTHLFKKPKESIRTLIPYGIGAVAGIIGLSFIIEWLFLNYPLPTNLFFIGLILGSVPMLYKNVKNKKINIRYIIAFVLMFVLVVGLSLVNGDQNIQVDLELSLIGSIKMFVVGIIASATMVIPGVSGSMVLTIMGYYLPIIETINQVIKHLVTFNFVECIQSAIMLIPFAIGVGLGIFLIAKLIEFLFQKAKTLVYWAILGLVISSPVAILIVAQIEQVSILSLVIGCICLMFGLKVATMLSE